LKLPLEAVDDPALRAKRVSNLPNRGFKQTVSAIRVHHSAVATAAIRDGTYALCCSYVTDSNKSSDFAMELARWALNATIERPLQRYDGSRLAGRAE
jgi:hypothetical protein